MNRIPPNAFPVPLSLMAHLQPSGSVDLVQKSPRRSKCNQEKRIRGITNELKLNERSWPETTTNGEAALGGLTGTDADTTVGRTGIRSIAGRGFASEIVSGFRMGCRVNRTWLPGVLG
jgi:hypothetical protein